VHDSRILDVVKRMLTAKVVMPDGTQVATIQGTPQVVRSPPLLSNIVLDEWDKEPGTCVVSGSVALCGHCNIFVRSERGWTEGDGIDSTIFGEQATTPNQRREELRHFPWNVHFLGFRFSIGRRQPCLRSSCRPRHRRD